jgi:hypothetical protein
VALRVLLAIVLSGCSVTDTVLEPKGSTGPPSSGPPIAVARTNLGSASLTSLETDGSEVFYTANTNVWRVQASGPFEQAPVSVAEGETSATGVVVVTEDSVYWVTSGPASLPYQYPSNLTSVPPGRVRKRSRAGGTTAETLFEGGSPCGLAVVGARVFWVDRGDPELDQSNGTVRVHDGAVSTLVTGEAAPTGLVADDEFLYWTRFGTKALAYTDGAVVRARQDGSEVTVLATGALQANTLVQDSSWLYLTGSQRVYRVKKDGSTGLVAITKDADAGGAMDFDFDELATDGKHVYWANRVPGWVQRLPVGGGVSELIAEGQVIPHLVALDDEYLYFAVSDAISRVAK